MDAGEAGGANEASAWMATPAPGPDPAMHPAAPALRQPALL